MENKEIVKELSKGIDMGHLVNKGDIVISRTDTNPYFGELKLLVKGKNDISIHTMTSRPGKKLEQSIVTLTKEEFGKLVSQLMEL